MNILFDYQAFETQKIGGVSRTFAELADGLNRLGNNCIVGVKESDNVYIKDKNIVEGLRPYGYRFQKWFGHEQLFHGEDRIKRFVFKLANYNLYPNEDYCLRLLRGQQFDVFHPTYYSSYFLKYLKDKPFVLTVHDMMPELFPEYFARNDFQIVQKKLLCPLAAHIHVPSMQTKNDLVNILNISPEKITVIPHGFSPSKIDGQKGNRLIGLPYVLYVGTRSEYKNFIHFVVECSKIIKDFPEIQLVCTGPEFNVEERDLFIALGISKNVKHFYASEDELNNLYQNAIAFVCPSLYEGFGMPVLEAFANHCPVMLNNTSCFPEVAGDAAIFFEMKDGKSDFYDKFKYLYELSEEDRESLINKGIERLSLYSWDKSAAMLEEVYKNCL